MTKPIDRQFEDLLGAPPSKGKKREQEIQDFLELHPELIPTPDLLHHRLNFGCIITKFPLSTELITDYVYISSSSDKWRVSLVELEVPEKKFFKKNTKKAEISGNFRAALDQVKSWKRFIQRNEDEAMRKLRPLMQPLAMSVNPVEFKYHLIYGRSQEKNLTEDRKAYIENARVDDGIEVQSYDGLLGWYRNGNPRPKNVLRLTEKQFAYKHLHTSPGMIFCHVGPEHLALSKDQATRLRADGYDLDRWEQGELLRLNGKKVPNF